MGSKRTGFQCTSGELISDKVAGQVHALQEDREDGYRASLLIELSGMGLLF